ncbi:MAG TPA: tyrosine-type recombinase/integrase [Aromatoleum sp.]|uniref:tyrosine-type recombinase/integrase n=1 Tax=Aromatoleum sp. TaxID=2307007 RepID=UPI002B49966E|nr:tyrosine-type recombinase/integrase [Aromatoleum sp.]HJV26324.1 tyrosine-type recombinase/integrase [Aromatoleum sp.]
MTDKDPTRISFSKERLAALPPAERGKRVTYHDAKIPGLQLRVTGKGVKTFCVYRRLKAGQPERITLGRFPAMTVEQARKAASAVVAEIEAGANPAEARRAHRGEPTVQEVFDTYVAHKRKRDGSPLSERSKAEYQHIARLHLEKIMPMKLSAVGHERIAQLHRRIGENAPYAANRTKALLSALFNYARDQRLYSGENPAAGLRGFAEESRDRFALPDELPHLFNAIAQSPQRDFFLLALLTGARRSNVQAMAWRDVDLDRALWRIGKTKNGTPQNVPLTAEAVAVLRARKEVVSGSPFVFPGTGKTGHLMEPKKAWGAIKRSASLSRLLDAMQATGLLDQEARTAADKLALENLTKAESRYHDLAGEADMKPADYTMRDIRIHDLRRTLGSWQAMTGASLAIIGKSLNHKSQQATAIYARLDIDPVRRSVTTATTAMLEAAGLKQGADIVSLERKKRVT